MLFLVAAACAVAACAAELPQQPEFTAIRVGLGDCYKVGLWTPVEVVLRGGDVPLSGRVSLIVFDGDGVPSRVSTPLNEPCTISPGAETTVRLLCRFGRVRGSLTAQLHVEEDVVAKKTFQVAAKADAEHFLPGLEARKLIVAVGSADVGIEEVGKLSGMEAEHRPVSAHIDDVAQLPVDWRGYEGFNAVIVSTSRPEIFENLTADSPQVEALDRWVRMGGRLVLCGGSGAEKLLADGGPLHRFLPGRLEGVQQLRHSRTGALENYCGTRTAVSSQGGKPTDTMPVLRVTEVQGIVEAQEADLPLVVRAARGFGQVMFVAAAIDEPPLSTWPDRARLVARLLDMPIGGADDAERGTAMIHFGYDDMAGQLRSALDLFSGVQAVPFWLVAALIVAYLLLIGPGDYFFLRKGVRRMTWTWLTFSSIVLLTCAGAYALANRLKGREIRVHQADLVDVDAASGNVQGATWFNIFSPRLESYDLSMAPQLPDGRPAQDAQVSLAWLGLPGDALGGMNPRAGGQSSWSEPYDFSSGLDAMRRVPIQLWATKSFTARWNATTTDIPRAELTADGQLIAGTIENTLDFALEDCILAYGRFVYELGTLESGKLVRIGAMSKRSELKTLLTGVKIVAGDTADTYRREVTPYNQSSVDAEYILRIMTFYEAAGGRNYTGLWNDYQIFVDMSALLKADRAILAAKTPSGKKNTGGATLLHDGRPLGGTQDRHGMMFRFVFPVKKEKGG